MIQLDHLTKRYGGFTAVDDVSFVARPGRVTGFLGPNGAGKSTTLRMLTQLTPPSSGQARVLGRRYGELPNPARHVGVMLDAAAQHPGRTGAEVLTLAAMITGAPRSRVSEMLELVGLDQDEARRRVNDYSLGMRQRLGLAGALMGDPTVLILDEPANGLDPAGIHWMRGLLRGFADKGGTVLLSSHLLHEVELIADDLVVIGQGRIVAQGVLSEMLTQTPGCVVDAEDRAGLTAALRSAGMAVTVRPDGGCTVDGEAIAVGRVALSAGIALRLLRPADRTGLEQLFLTLTTPSTRDGAEPPPTMSPAAMPPATIPPPPGPDQHGAHALSLQQTSSQEYRA